jgi:hypothetical protein
MLEFEIKTSTYTLSLTSLINNYVYLNFLTSELTMILLIKTITLLSLLYFIKY